MAKLKLKKLPKKPKANASLAVLQNYVAKVKETNSYNAAIEKEEKARKALLQKIRSGSTLFGVSKPKRRLATKKVAKKAAKKSTAKRKR